MKDNRKLMNIVVKAASLLVLAFIAIFAVASVKAIGVDGYKAILDYDTLAEAQEAAKNLNIEITGEGSVLLKNDGTLPVSEDSKVVVFGSAATSLQGGKGRVDTALTEAGFDVYPTVFNESSVKNGIDTRQFDLFHDLAVVVLKRGGGEGSDLSTLTNEVAVKENAIAVPTVGSNVALVKGTVLLTDKGEYYSLKENLVSDALTEDELKAALDEATFMYPDSFEHLALGKKSDGLYYKHGQQLTNDEYRMIEFAKANFNKVVVLLNTSNAMEVKTLDEDPEINGILWIGRPGDNGVYAVGPMLKGEVNPSGKLADEWFVDFTTDPTWYNFGSNNQNDAGSNTYVLADGSGAHSAGLHGIDYEEGIYLGYKYTETVAYEIMMGHLSVDPASGDAIEGANANEKAENWHEANVMYPFGYGLSYTDFQYEILSMTYQYEGTKDLTAGISHTLVESSIGHTARVKFFDVKVKVTNTGYVSGKEVVQIYVNAPYTSGKVEKAAVSLVQFEKTSLLKPGRSEILTIRVNFQDIASYDYLGLSGSKGYVLEAGEYGICASGSSSIFDETMVGETFTLDALAYLQLDDWSDNPIYNLFSKENGTNYSLRMNDADWNEDGEVNASDKIFTEEMTQLTRANLAGTFPKAPTKLGYVDETPVSSIPEYDKANSYAVNALFKVTVKGQSSLSGSTPDQITYYKVTTAIAANAESYAENVEVMTPALQGDLVATGLYADLIAYWDTYNLDTFVETPAFSDTTYYPVGSNVKYTDGKIYEFVKAHGPAPDISPANSYAVNATGNYQGYVYTCVTAWTRIANHARNTNYQVGDRCTNGGKYYVCTKAHKAGRNINLANWEEIPADTINAEFIACFEKGDPISTFPWDAADVKLVDTSSYTVVPDKGYYKYSDFYYEFNPATGLTERKTIFDTDLIEGWTQMADTAAQTAAKEAAGDAWISWWELGGISYLDTTLEDYRLGDSCRDYRKHYCGRSPCGL